MTPGSAEQLAAGWADRTRTFTGPREEALVAHVLRELAGPHSDYAELLGELCRRRWATAAAPMADDLAPRIVWEWAADRCTQPTPAGCDLTRWITERIGEDPDLAMAKAALDSWHTRARPTQTAPGQREDGAS